MVRLSSCLLFAAASAVTAFAPSSKPRPAATPTMALEAAKVQPEIDAGGLAKAVVRRDSVLLLDSYSYMGVCACACLFSHHFTSILHVYYIMIMHKRQSHNIK